jgi:carboxylesterase type B
MSLDVVKVLRLLQSSLSDPLLQNYGLSKSQTTKASSIGDIMPNLIAFKTDELFAASIARFNREFAKNGNKVYGYHFDRGNQFTGALNGVAHHAVDLQYIFGNFNDGFTDKKDLDLSNALMRLWIGFANGKEPWADYSSGKTLHITPEGDLTVVPREEVTSRRWNAYGEIENNLAEIKKIGGMLTNGDPELKSECIARKGSKLPSTKL